jgi:chemotaxis protein MotB
VAEQKVNIVQNSRGVRIDINDSLLFEPGSAELSPRAVPLMTQIADSVKDSAYNLQIEGHTDNIPIHSELYFSNWELSALRASSVVRMLSTMNIKENRLSATGFGATQPISENETPAGRSKNRRVAILIMYESASKIDDAMPISAASLN